MNAPLPLAATSASSAMAEASWVNSFALLGADFSTALAPRPVPQPHWVGRNARLAHELSLDEAWLATDEALQTLAGNSVLPGMRPLASVYSGHQFGVWAGQLGDGRAVLLGEQTDHAGHGWEWQLKGSGLTPYSRGGDGRAVLRSSIREYLASEAMHGLGIPTTRALAVVGTPLPVQRESIETGAVVTRVAPSFVRFGHFEHFAAREQVDALRRLADYVIARHYPDAADAAPPGANAYAGLLRQVVQRSAELVAHWQAVGFCHGVLNTDNMSILGLTLDYGPFQFMDGFDPAHICNHSDTQGRYAYARQPSVVYWNLFCLGQALLPLIGEQDHALAALEPYRHDYPAAYTRLMLDKLGLNVAKLRADSARELIDPLLKLMAQDKVDYTILWRRLSHAVHDSARAEPGPAFAPVRDLFVDRAALETWLLSYLEHLSPLNRALAGQNMLNVNPAVVLRNHLGEDAIQSARAGDFSRVQGLLDVLARPFDTAADHTPEAGFAPDWASSIAISCSS
jgi:serine/tyrosine/threonine adenylyltransferase